MSNAQPQTTSDLPQLVTAIPGPRSQALAQDLQTVEPSMVTYSDAGFPVFWESASGCLITDVDQNRFLDLSSAFAVQSLGHAHPHVVAAGQKQLARLSHGMGDVHPAALKVQLAQKILSLLPSSFARVFFSSTGTEAVETALKTAYRFTQKLGVLAFRHAYHGLGYGALSATARDDFRSVVGPQLARFTVHAEYGDLGSVEELLSRHRDIGAILIEPVQGRGGVHIPSFSFLQALRALADRHQMVLIYDEVLTGLGRTGKWFAFEHSGAVPDLLCLGKTLGGGFPISACVGREAVMESWGPSSGEALHTSTFLGHPVGCAMALAVIETLERDLLVERSREMGEYFLHQLKAFKDRYLFIRDIRGIGLMIGIELDSGKRTFKVVKAMLQKGVILLGGGTDHNVLTLTPPFVITKQQVDWAVMKLDEAMQSAGN